MPGSVIRCRRSRTTRSGWRFATVSSAPEPLWATSRSYRRARRICSTRHCGISRAVGYGVSGVGTWPASGSVSASDGPSATGSREGGVDELPAPAKKQPTEQGQAVQAELEERRARHERPNRLPETALRSPCIRAQGRVVRILTAASVAAWTRTDRLGQRLGTLPQMNPREYHPSAAKPFEGALADLARCALRRPAAGRYWLVRTTLLPERLSFVREGQLIFRGPGRGPKPRSLGRLMRAGREQSRT
jgi:hypothetical protein